MEIIEQTVVAERRRAAPGAARARVAAHAEPAQGGRARAGPRRLPGRSQE